MKSPFSDEYWRAAMNGIETLAKMGCWDVVDRSEGAHIIDSTWAFKIKCYPDGLIKKFKAHFCVCGDQQIHGVDVMGFIVGCIVLFSTSDLPILVVTKSLISESTFCIVGIILSYIKSCCSLTVGYIVFRIFTKSEPMAGLLAFIKR